MRSKLVAGVAALAVASLTAGALVYAAGGRTGGFVFATGGDGIAGPPPHQPSHLLFVSNRDGDGDVYAVGAGGHPLAALTRDADDEHSLVSKDGRRLAFTRDRNGPIVYTSDGVGRHVRRVGSGEPLAWSAGNARLAYDAGGIVVVNANGTHRLRLTKDRDSNPPTTTFEDWSPDGRQLVFSRRIGSDLVSHYELYVVDVTQPAPKPSLLASESSIVSASWSPAGNAIAFRYYDDSSNREAVAVVDPDSGRTRVLASADRVSDPKWSPDGRRLLFSLGSYSVRSVTPLDAADIEAGTSTVLAHARGIDTFAWSPDGRAVAFTAERGLGIVDADGHDFRWLRRQQFEPGSYTWSPDGTRLAFVDAGGLRTIQANGLGLRTLVTRGSIELVAWVRGPVPAAAPRARPLPPIEVGSAVAFRSRGRVEQMVAAGGRAAVLSAASHLDGEHVTVWSPAARSVARGGPPDPTPPIPNYQLGGLRISGRNVSWSGDWSCGNSECSRKDFVAIVVSPTRLRVSVEYVVVSSKAYARLPCVVCGQPTPTRRHPDTVAGALSTYVSGRVIHVLLHGRELNSIRPPGTGTVLARLGVAGLFYAYNLPRGPQPGQVRFVPLRTLLR
jgi:Tol biopolymer transport system component